MEEDKAILDKFKEKAKKGQIVTVKEIRKAYEEAVGHETKPSFIYKVLNRHGWGKVMPRSKHPKNASNEAIEASKKIKTKAEERFSELPCGSGKKIRLMFQDEAGFGRINKPRQCWCEKG